MKFATFALTATLALALLTPATASADLPDGKVAVVRVTAIEGLVHATGPRTETRSTLFSYDGNEYRVDRSALASLDGVETLLLIDRRKDETGKSGVLRRYEQEVRTFENTAFEIKDFRNKSLHYQVAMIGGNLRLLGDGDQIFAQADGPYQIWKITGIDLVDRAAVTLR